MNKPNPQTDHPPGTVEFLVRRMQHHGDFPGLSDSIRTINRLAEAKNKSLDQLAAAVVQDYALTQKILKIVNSACYGTFAGKIGTITRAIVVLGVEPIRALAASLVFFEHLSDQARAAQVRDRIGTAMFQAVFARETALACAFGEVEEAFLAGMFHGLGEALVGYYLPEEHAAIARLCDQEDLTLEQAAHRVLGIDVEELGIAVAARWNLPKTITHSMKSLPPKAVRKAHTVEEQLRQLANFSAGATQLLAQGKAPSDPAMKDLQTQFAAAFDIEQDALAETASRSHSAFRRFAQGLLTKHAQTPVLRQLAASSAIADGDDEELKAQDAEEPEIASNGEASDTQSTLVQGLQEVTTCLAEQANVNQVATLVLETLYRALQLHRISVCLRDRLSGDIAARLAIGNDIDTFKRKFKLTSQFTPDVFHAALKSNNDVHIADIASGGTRHGIPTWYRALMPRGSLLVLPISVGPRPVGILLAEHGATGGIETGAKSLELIRSLRNQLALALRLSATP